MRDFEQGMFSGKVLDDGPYPARLCVRANAAEEEIEWPSEEWISQQAGEEVVHWCSEAAEEIYLPVSTNLDEAETCRRAFGP